MPTSTFTGLRGATGSAATIAAGTASTLAYGATPTVTNSGTSSAAIFDFGIPTGPQGPPGQKGESGGFVIRHKYDSFTSFQADTDPINNHGFGVGDLALIGGDETAAEYGRMYLYKGAGNGEPGTQNTAWQYLVDLSVAGVQGPTGASASIQLASSHLVTNDPAAATVTNSGTQQDAIFQFTIPRGPQGDTPTIAVGTVTKVAAANNATVTNSGTNTAVVLDFEIPAGNNGATGDRGDSIASATLTTNAQNSSKLDLVFTLDDLASTQLNAVQIDKPTNATISVGTVSALTAGATPTVTNSGDSTTATFDFGIPGSPTVSAGTASALAAGATPTVTNSGTSTAAVFDFGIPTGPQGVGVSSVAIAENSGNSAQWDLTLTLSDASTTTTTFDKPSGVVDVVAVDVDTIKFELSDGSFTSNFDLPRGLTGPSGTLAIGTVSTVASGNNATVALDNTSTYNASNQATHGIFNFSIPKGRGFTSIAIADNPNDNTQYRLTFTSDDSTTSTDTIDFDKPTNGTNGTGFTGGSYNASTGVVTFTSDDGLGFSTTDLRGADGADGSTTLNDLDNVDLVTNAPTNGQTLTFNGTNFVPTTPLNPLIYAIALG